MQILELTRIHLTKAADALRLGSGTAWEALGLDKWVRSPIVSEIADRYPGLIEDLQGELASAFSPPGMVDLFALLSFPNETTEKRDMRAQEIAKMKPFEIWGSPGRDHFLAFLDYVEPKLVTKLPANLHHLHVDQGNLDQGFLITVDSLAGSDFDRLLDEVDPRDSSRYKVVRLCLEDIIAILGRARREGADVVATVA